MSARVEIHENNAIISIGEVCRRYPIEYKENHPHFVQPVRVGVKLGKSGSKIWLSSLSIHKNDRFAKYKDPEMARIAGVSEYVLGAFSPLNSVNRDFVNVSIVAFWDLVEDAQKSKR